MELLKVEGLKKYFHLRGNRVVKAVDGVTFSLSAGEAFGLVGESGCGKSTVAKLVLKLLEPTSGRIFFKGRDVTAARGKELSSIRKGLQIIFQDPLASLNPRMNLLDSVGEALIVNRIVSKSDVKERVLNLLQKVGVDGEALYRYPHEFSGGQRQRICIARALAVEPRLIVADEALSALDVSIQAQIMNLLDELRKDSGLSYLFISHNLLAVEHFSDRVAVMYLGKIVEMSGTNTLFKEPLHPYTEALLSAVPKPWADERGKRIVLEGDVPSPADIPSGCPFHPRCPKRFAPCDTIVPEFREAKEGSFVSCHLWG
ncbi:MAG: ATP-binding cassette domain-containing protein [Nitrospirae bacterium]|nr:ATP-binding cassette domain-containing protein [Nitrospirota bacterium]